MKFKAYLRDLLDNPSTKHGRIFAFTIQILIVASLVSFSIETLPDISTEERRWLHYFEVFTIVVFTAEYALRIWTAKRKGAFVFSFYGLVDLFAILPFYLSAGLIDLRSIRVFRLLRLLRLLKLARYSSAMARFRVALNIVKGELLIFSFLALVLLYLSAVGIYYFERGAQPAVFRSIFDALWWAVATLTTVGYGDIFPITAGGRFFTFIVLMIGLGIVAVPTGLVASALTEARGHQQAHSSKPKAVIDTENGGSGQNEEKP